MTTIMTRYDIHATAWMHGLMFVFFCQKRRKMKDNGSGSKGPDVPPAVREKMKKAFIECYKAVLACEDETGRKRCELFREPPDRRVSGRSLLLA